MSHVDDLKSLRTQAVAALSAALADPRPTYKLDGEFVQFSEYMAELRAQIKDLTDQIAAEEDPFEYESIGFTP